MHTPVSPLAIVQAGPVGAPDEEDALPSGASLPKRERTLCACAMRSEVAHAPQPSKYCANVLVAVAASVVAFSLASP